MVVCFFLFTFALVKYVDVIMPLPLDGLFTYAVPASFAERLQVGHRVLVPFGRNKTYVGVVAELHDRKPSGYVVKDILQQLDASPILLESQLKLWKWISDYYMSPIGEVYKAALPSGLKAEDGYRPKTELYIRLTPNFRNVQALHVALNMLQRAGKQQEAFIHYLALSHWDTLEGQTCRETPVEITRDELLNSSHASLQTLNALVKRGLLETYELEVGRWRISNHLVRFSRMPIIRYSSLS